MTKLSRLVLRFLVPVAASLASAPCWATAGHIVFASGDARVMSDSGAERPARLGDAVNVKDSLATNRGLVQIRFTDGGYVSLQPGTQFRIDGYQWSGREDGTENAVFSFVRGALRAVTGAIGHKNRRAYSVNTVVATIGIRGTAFRAEMCTDGSCAGKADGLYAEGGEGIIGLSNGAGDIALARGQSGYVATATSAPRYTSALPNVSQATSPRTRAADGGEVASTAATVAATGAEAFRVADVLLQQVAGETVRAIAAGGGALAASVSNLSVPADLGAHSFVSFGAEGEEVRVAIDPHNAIVGLYLKDLATGDTGVIRTSHVENFGHDGTFYWGRWTNGTLHAEVTDSQGFRMADESLPAGKNFHYMLFDRSATIPAAGVATYQFAVATQSTSVSGQIGQGVISGDLSANFATNTLGLNMSVDHFGQYIVHGTLRPEAGNRQNFGSYSAFDVEVPIVTSGTGAYPTNVRGAFGGGNTNVAPNAAALSYRINRPGDAIVGTAGFKCASGC
ncbi:MAG: hypothetical protein IOMNBAOH_02418 [Rhodocyclaceae bacterium]|nr:hypothetical protein [Rhodocyclaceae bacterium]